MKAQNCITWLRNRDWISCTQQLLYRQRGPDGVLCREAWNLTTTAVARIHSVCLFYWLCVTVTETALLARPRYSCSTYYRLANTFVALMGVVAARHRTIIHRARLKRINRASPGYAKLCNVSCPCAVRHTERFSSARVIMSLYMFIHSNQSQHCKTEQ